MPAPSAASLPRSRGPRRRTGRTQSCSAAPAWPTSRANCRPHTACRWSTGWRRPSSWPRAGAARPAHRQVRSLRPAAAQTLCRHLRAVRPAMTAPHPPRQSQHQRLGHRPPGGGGALAGGRPGRDRRRHRPLRGCRHRVPGRRCRRRPCRPRPGGRASGRRCGHRRRLHGPWAGGAARGGPMPAVGLAESGVRAAAAGGRHFAIVSLARKLAPAVHRVVGECGVADRLVALRYVSGGVLALAKDRAAFLEEIAGLAGRLAEEGAEAILFGGRSSPASAATSATGCRCRSSTASATPSRRRWPRSRPARRGRPRAIPPSPIPACRMRWPGCWPAGSRSSRRLRSGAPDFQSAGL